MFNNKIIGSYKDMNKNESPEYIIECDMVAQLFSSDIGQRFKKYLDGWLKTPVIMPEENSNFAYYREGRKDLIRLLFEMEDNSKKCNRG